MREFAFGTDTQFDNLKSSLQDGECHVYKDCVMPECCENKICRIGFELSNGVYLLLIDFGVPCNDEQDSPVMNQLRAWLTDGELKFLDFNDLKTFLKNLQFLF